MGVQKQEFVVGQEMAAGQMGAQFGGGGASTSGSAGGDAATPGPSGNKKNKVSK